MSLRLAVIGFIILLGMGTLGSNSTSGAKSMNPDWMHPLR